jgi:hypothetical protein
MHSREENVICPRCRGSGRLVEGRFMVANLCEG